VKENIVGKSNWEFTSGAAQIVAIPESNQKN